MEVLMPADERAGAASSWRSASLFTVGVPEIGNQCGHVTDDGKRLLTRSNADC
jgi:hypothetical protein